MEESVNFTSGVGFLLSVLKYKPTTSFLSEFRLSPKDFSGTEAKLLKEIQNFVGQYQKFPELEQVEVSLGLSFPPLPPGDPLYWADEIHSRFLSIKTAKVASEMVKDCADGKLENIVFLLDNLKKEYTDRHSSANIIPFKVVAEEVLERHDQIQKNPELPGVSFGMDYLDQVSGGCQPGDFNIVVGRPSSGKTYLMLNMAISAYNSGKNVAWVVTEMTKLQYATRALALRTKMNYNRIRWGRLSTLVGRKELVEEVGRIKEIDTGFYFINSGVSSNIHTVIADLHSCKPDVVYVDGAYLLQVNSRSRYEKVSDGADILKAAARELNVPVIASYQFRKNSAGTADDTYQSDVMLQLASIMLGMKDDTTEETAKWGKKKFKILTILKGREGESGSIRVLFDMDYTSIVQTEVLSRNMDDEDSYAS
jgi:replicative DNA helicase